MVEMWDAHDMPNVIGDSQVLGFWYAAEDSIIHLAKPGATMVLNMHDVAFLEVNLISL